MALPAEREKVMVELCRMWPGKFADEEVQDFAERLAPFRMTDVLTALNDHKNSQKFKPAVSEILGRLKGKTQPDAQATAKADDFVTILRKGNEHWREIKDNREVVLRYWRSVWFRYAMEAEKRKPDANLPGGKARADLFEAQWKGMRAKCMTGCVYSLCSEGMSEKDADAFAAYVFKPPEEFKLALLDLRGEVADPFETAA